MKQSNEENSRSIRNKKRRSDRLVNWLIAAVVLGIFIIGWIVLSPSDSAQPDKESPAQDEQDGEENNADEDILIEEPEDDGLESPPLEEPEEDDQEQDFEEEIEILEDSSDEFVEESRIDPTWEPIGTTQSGEHVSVYDKGSVDWKEKEQALLYATGLTEGDVIFWKIKNGGDPQRSIGIVSSMDQVEKYRVYLEWVDGEGWQPVQLDVLNTLEFDF